MKKETLSAKGHGKTRTGFVVLRCTLVFFKRSFMVQEKGPCASHEHRGQRREAPVENSPAREGGAGRDAEWRSEGPAQRSYAAPSALVSIAHTPRPHGRLLPTLDTVGGWALLAIVRRLYLDSACRPEGPSVASHGRKAVVRELGSVSAKGATLIPK